MPERERNIARVESSSTWQSGPTKITLPCGASIDLPDEYRYLDIPQSKTLLKAYGQVYVDGSQGMISSVDMMQDWRAFLVFDDSGYVKDDEEIDADDLLKALREGQEAVNKKRIELGHPALRLGGWSARPRYDPLEAPPRLGSSGLCRRRYGRGDQLQHSHPRPTLIHLAQLGE